MPFLREEIYLIGYSKLHLTGSKLPSKGDCLRVLFYNLRSVNLSIKESARLVIKECLIFWKKARIPVQKSDKAEKKLEMFYNEWRSLSKHKKRDSESFKKQTVEWKESLNDLFDIAHIDALNIIKIEEDKIFLIKQRLKGREGSMLGVDINLKKREEKRQNRQLQEENRRKKIQEAPSTSTGLIIDETYTSDELENPESIQIEDNIIDHEKPKTSATSQTIQQVREKRPTKKILTPRLAAVLDKLKISSRDSVHLLVAVLDAVKLNASEYIINRHSIRKQRDILRKAKSEKIKSKFAVNTPPLTIHWDTKLLSSLTGKTEDRLAIIATAPDLEHILNMPDIPAGTGLEISSAVYDTLEDNNILDKTQAFVFDTTASNTGKFNGACILLEKRIGRNILFLGCRHHICEIVLAAVFTEAKVEASTGPEIRVFKKFKKHWPKIQQDTFLTGVTYPRFGTILGEDGDNILRFANKKILEDFPRNDYKELLELIIIFLGGSPPRGIKFTKPGALHLARWMAKAIYCLKILIFRNQFPEITEIEVNGLIEVAGFVIKCYSVYWFNAAKAEQAPLNDIDFLKNLENYKKINQNIAEKAISKFLNHLYYMNEECVGFALFDDRVDFKTKAKLAAKIGGNISEEDNLEEDEEIPKKLTLKHQNLNNFLKKNNLLILEELFSKNTQKLLKRFKISTDFLKIEPHLWYDLPEYRRGKHIIGNLKIVNDCAERGIKLIQEYHEKITKDEDQRQHLFKVVQNYRQQFSKEANLKNLRCDYN